MRVLCSPLCPFHVRGLELHRSGQLGADGLAGRARLLLLAVLVGIAGAGIAAEIEFLRFLRGRVPEHLPIVRLGHGRRGAARRVPLARDAVEGVHAGDGPLARLATEQVAPPDLQ